MKSMTCKQLGGACNLEFKADTFEEIAEMSKNHGMEMFQKGDKAHLDAMNDMQKLMQSKNAFDKWMNEKMKEFDALHEID